MNKELLEVLAKNIRYKKEYIGNDTYRLYIKKNDIELLEEYLTELEQIKNTKPSEALKCLERIKNQLFEYFESTEVRTDDMEDYEKLIFEPIKQALLKSQEQEKILSIIKEKNVDIIYLKDSNNVEEYNSHFGCAICKLTPEEFELLKRWANEITRVKN